MPSVPFEPLPTLPASDPSAWVQALRALPLDQQQAIAAAWAPALAPPHRLEREWGISAQELMGAIYGASDLIRRGIRGILAESVFQRRVLPRALPGGQSLPPLDEAYDAYLAVAGRDRPVRIQVKNQRSERQQPKHHALSTAKQPVYVVEVQRTRNGVRADQSPSRPYRFDEFDVLAVCLRPSSGAWDEFIYCATRHLTPRLDDATMIAPMQRVHLDGQGGWSRSLAGVIAQLP